MNDMDWTGLDWSRVGPCGTDRIIKDQKEGGGGGGGELNARLRLFTCCRIAPAIAPQVEKRRVSVDQRRRRRTMDWKGVALNAKLLFNKNHSLLPFLHCTAFSFSP